MSGAFSNTGREHHVLLGVSEMCLTRVALPEHCGFVPSTYRTDLKYNSNFRGHDALFRLPQDCMYAAHIHAGKNIM